MNAEKTKACVAQNRANLSECIQTACDILDQSRVNAAKLRFSAQEREVLETALDALTFLDYLLNK